MWTFRTTTRLLNIIFPEAAVFCKDLCVGEYRTPIVHMDRNLTAWNENGRMQPW